MWFILFILAAAVAAGFFFYPAQTKALVVKGIDWVKTTWTNFTKKPNA